MNIRSKKFQNEINFVLLGAKSTGKTVFLTTIYGDVNKVSPLGSPTTKYLKNKWKKLQKHENPDATGAGELKILKFFYQSDDFGRVEFAIDDYDGNFTETVSKIEDDEQKELNIHKDAKSVVDKHMGARKDLLDRVHVSQGIIFVLPYEMDDIDRLEAFSSEVSAFINLAHFPKQSKSHIPASVVITKWDESGFMDKDDENKKALEYIESNEHLNKAYTLIKSNFENVNIVPVSAYKKYNLLKPIDFSLKHTFDKWYRIAKEYESKKEDDKLIRFLAKWYESINIDILNEKYPFNDIYKKVQQRYVSYIEQQLNKKETLTEKEEYLNKVVDLYKTEKKLLLPLKEKIEEAKKQEKRKKFLIKLSTIMGIATLVFLGLGLYNKFKVDETYKYIVSKADQNTTSYQDIKDEIQHFMVTYDPKNVLYAFSRLVEKRSNLQKLGVKLESRDKKNVQNNIDQIISDQTSTPDEEKRELENLLIYSTGTQKIDIIQKISNANNKDLTKSWKDEVERCLKVCKDENDISLIKELRDKVKNDISIIHDKEVEEKIIALNEREKKIKDDVDFGKLYGRIDNLNSLVKIKKFLNDNREKINYNNQKIRTEIVSQIIKVNEDNYDTKVGKKLIEDLKVKNNVEGVITYIDNDLTRFIKNKQKYKTIVKSITDTPNYADLKKIPFDNFDSFEKEEKKTIVSKIDAKLNKSLNDVMDRLGNSEGIKELKKVQKKVNEFKNFSLQLGSKSYKFEMPTDEEDKNITKLSEDIKTLDDLDKKGVSGITVSLKKLAKDNTLGFGCGTWSDPQITIKGFKGSDLSYDNDKSKCYDNDILVFENKVHLYKGQTRLKIKAHSGVNNEIAESIDVSLQDLKDLNDANGVPVEKLIDDENLKLVFRKNKK